jgi:hypothetical protein
VRRCSPINGLRFDVVPCSSHQLRIKLDLIHVNGCRRLSSSRWLARNRINCLKLALGGFKRLYTGGARAFPRNLSADPGAKFLLRHAD